MGAGVSFALGPPGPPQHGHGRLPALESFRPPPHGPGSLLQFGFTEAPAAWGRGPPSLWDHQGPRRMGMGTSPLRNH